MRYSFSPERKLRRVTVISLYSEGTQPVLLSMVSETSAIPSGALPCPPEKMISSLFLPRNWRMLCSPSTQRTASATFDFPAPFGPTTAVIPVLNSSEVRTAKLLKPSISKRLRYTESSVPLSRSVQLWNDDTTVKELRRDGVFR